MAEAHRQPEVNRFIAWLTRVIETKEDTRVLLAEHLGPGGKKKIDDDLSGAYLPAWQYVVSTYLGPVEGITSAALRAEVLDEGEQLYEAATRVAVPYVPRHRRPEVNRFIAWLTRVIETKEDTRVLLGEHLGPGGKKKIDDDLSGAYLPAWQHVVSTYLGPVEEITSAAVMAEVLDEGKQLYEAATPVAVPYVPSEDEHESYSRVVAPVLAGFSLPAIVTLATVTTPVQPYRDIALSFFITATGFFLISFQLTIGLVYIRLYHWGKLRAGLTFFGIVFLVTGVMVLIAAVAENWWVDFALAALGLGGVTSVLAMGWLKLPISRRWTL